MKLFLSKKLRVALAVMAFAGCTAAFAGCTAAFAADGQAAFVQVSPDAYSYCHDGSGHGHHHGCGW